MLIFSKNCGNREGSDQMHVPSAIQALPPNQSNIYDDFIHRAYDQFIFTENPQVTDELKVILATYNREFIQRLFTKCNSQKALEFWLQEAGAKLPEDTWALAVNLGNNIFVLQYLKENGWFDDLSRDDMTRLLSRAEKFKGEGLEYLKVQFERKSALTL